MLAAAGTFVAGVCTVYAPKPFGFEGSSGGSIREAAGSAYTGEADLLPEVKNEENIYKNIAIKHELERRN